MTPEKEPLEGRRFRRPRIFSNWPRKLSVPTLLILFYFADLIWNNLNTGKFDIENTAKFIMVWSGMIIIYQFLFPWFRHDFFGNKLE